MPKVRLIDAVALMKNVCGKECGCNFSECGIDDDNPDTRCVFREYVKTAPTIEAEPVRHGQWSDNGEDKYICSVCSGYVYRWFGKSDFCPRCGAKMQTEPPESEVQE